MEQFYKIVFICIRIVNSLIPKSSKKILFISRPDFSDNTLHLFRYMRDEIGVKQQLYWLIYDKKIFMLLRHKGYKNIYYLKSIQGIWCYFRCKIIISSSSSLWQIKSPFQKQYDLWHGIPLKNILCMGEKNKKPIRQASTINRRFATSSLSKALLSASFDFNALKIDITGQPRTDALYSNSYNLKKLFDTSRYNKIVIYMPTYRVGYKSFKDGKKIDKKSKNIFRFEEYEHSRFLSFLEKNSILFILKLHPFEEKIFHNVNFGQNIVLLTNEMLVDADMSLYDLLNGIDILITDYSSVYFDFLLSDRRIIFVPSDLEQYKKNRGFEIEPYEFWTPGEKVFSQDALQDSLLRNDQQDEKMQRKVVRDIMFRYQDGNSCKRVYEVIKRESVL